MNSRHVLYIQCCKLWLELHKDSNHTVLLIYKLTHKLYYKLYEEFNFIQIVYNDLASKNNLTDDDFNIIDKELSKYPTFFESMMFVIQAMNT